ncbi:MAG: biotin/lipoyl-binding protein [Planctomycetota bacterium]|nr:biotin/lipoyl-binding protein [Planctomycetota bacterium]
MPETPPTPPLAPVDGPASHGAHAAVIAGAIVALMGGRPADVPRAVAMARHAPRRSEYEFTNHDPLGADRAPQAVVQPAEVRFMKLRVTVDGKSYDVEVEVRDAGVFASAASRVEGARVDASHLRANHAPAHAPVHTSPRPAPAEPAPPAEPARPPWHGLTVAGAGECVSPVPGVVTAVLVKPGDAVKARDPLVELEVSHLMATSDRPTVGTVRALEGGVIAEVSVRPGDPVKFGQLLVRVRTPAH